MPSKDGPMNLRQKGMGGGRGSSAPSGGGRGKSVLAGGNKTLGRAQRMAKAMANKDIKASRKQSGVSTSVGKYPKSLYGRKSVNPRMPAAKTKPSSGRMSSGYKKGPGRG